MLLLRHRKKGGTRKKVLIPLALDVAVGQQQAVSLGSLLEHRNLGLHPDPRNQSVPFNKIPR